MRLRLGRWRLFAGVCVAVAVVTVSAVRGGADGAEAQRQAGRLGQLRASLMAHVAADDQSAVTRDLGAIRDLATRVGGPGAGQAGEARVRALVAVRNVVLGLPHLPSEATLEAVDLALDRDGTDPATLALPADMSIDGTTAPVLDPVQADESGEGTSDGQDVAGSPGPGGDQSNSVTDPASDPAVDDQ